MRAQALVLLALATAPVDAAPANAPAAPAVSAAQREFEAATGREAAGDYKGAQAALEALARAHPGDPFAADALFEAATLAEERLGDPAHALALYQQLLHDYPRTRLERRAHARADFLSSSLKTGEAPLREYQELLNGAASRPPRDSIARMERLLAGHSDFALADRALYWLGGALATEGRFADAEARYRELERRFPSSEWAGRGKKAHGDLLLRRGHPLLARALFEELAARGPDPLSRAAGGEGLAEVRTTLRRLVEAIVAAAYLLAFVIAHAWALARRRRLFRVPLELLYYLPVAGVFVAAAATENRAIGFATAGIAAGGALVVWLAAGAAAARFDAGEAAMRLGERVWRAGVAAVAVLAVLFLSVQGTGLTDLVIETLRSGPER